MRESFQARENEMDSQKTEREKKKKKGREGRSEALRANDIKEA